MPFEEIEPKAKSTPKVSVLPNQVTVGSRKLPGGSMALVVRFGIDVVRRLDSVAVQQLKPIAVRVAFGTGADAGKVRLTVDTASRNTFEIKPPGKGRKVHVLFISNLPEDVHPEALAAAEVCHHETLQAAGSGIKSLLATLPRAVIRPVVEAA